MKIFISWSKDNSKAIADAVANSIKEVFSDINIQVFFSPETIASGSEWNAEITNSIADSDCAILCCTPESTYSPWLNFEAGACTINSKSKIKIIPLLVGQAKVSDESPLSHYDYVVLSDMGFKKMIRDINENFRLSSLMIPS